MNFWKSQHNKDEEERIAEEEYKLDRDAVIKQTMESYKVRRAQEKTEAAEREKVYLANRKKMYTLEHYKRLDIHNDTWVERVPGGWIFYNTKDTNNNKPQSTFVPYTEEKFEMFYTLKNKKYDDN